MERREHAWSFLAGSPGAWLPIIGATCTLALSTSLPRLPSSPDPMLFGQLQFTSGIVAVTFAGAEFIRFRGTQSRLPLILAAGSVIIGITLSSSSLGLLSLSPFDPTASLRDPMTWVIGRTFLAIFLVAALLAQHRYEWSRNPGRDFAAALALVVLVSALLSITHRYLPSDVVVQPGHFFPRPGNLIPAALFLLAALAYHRRLKIAAAPLDVSLYLAATINFWSSVAAAQSDRRLDATFALAAILQFSGFAVILGGAFLANLRLFRETQRFAVTDSVTGLANYRQLTESLELEIQRTNRSGRPFALLLFDLDGLKKINDQFGHAVGTRALCRVADVLRAHSRAIDTASRHGGDEFTLLLPETMDQGAQGVMSRVCDQVASDGKQPSISLSAGFAIYPRDGNTAEALMVAADSALYRMKERHKRSPSFVKQATV